MACKVLALQVCGLDPRCLGRTHGEHTSGMGTYRTGCLGRERSRCGGIQAPPEISVTAPAQCCHLLGVLVVASTACFGLFVGLFSTFYYFTVVCFL